MTRFDNQLITEAYNSMNKLTQLKNNIQNEFFNEQEELDMGADYIKRLDRDWKSADDIFKLVSLIYNYVPHDDVKMWMEICLIESFEI
tara:strand:- start:218 stop:481 length:264 start_codon:yes stop_codon:yes gene_type:complete